MHNDHIFYNYSTKFEIYHMFSFYFSFKLNRLPCLLEEREFSLALIIYYELGPPLPLFLWLGLCPQLYP